MDKKERRLHRKIDWLERQVELSYYAMNTLILVGIAAFVAAKVTAKTLMNYNRTL